jgi:hypothetical protein
MKGLANSNKNADGAPNVMYEREIFANFLQKFKMTNQMLLANTKLFFWENHTAKHKTELSTTYQL